MGLAVVEAEKGQQGGSTPRKGLVAARGEEGVTASSALLSETPG